MEMAQASASQATPRAAGRWTVALAAACACVVLGVGGTWALAAGDALGTDRLLSPPLLGAHLVVLIAAPWVGVAVPAFAFARFWRCAPIWTVVLGAIVGPAVVLPLSGLVTLAGPSVRIELLLVFLAWGLGGAAIAGGACRWRRSRDDSR